MAEKDVGLRVTINNTKPVELIDFGKSFEALGQLYEDFVHDNGFETVAGNARLYVVDVHRGSIIADLKGFLDQASFVVDHTEVLASFMANIYDLIEFFRVQPSNRPEEKLPSRAEAQRISQVFEPVAKDGGSQISFFVNGNTAPVTINNIVVNSERANAVQNNVRRYLGPVIPDSGRFNNEVLYLEQMRGNSRTSVGDRGIIEKYSVKPVKLHFMSPAVKAEIVDRPRNPFRTTYLVDGEVSTAKGQPALYKIYEVHEVIAEKRRLSGKRKAATKRTPKGTKKKQSRKKAS
jgi:hypothetical protein